MKPWILLALALLVPRTQAQDTVLVARDLHALKARGVRAGIQSKTVKRNPDNGRSTLDMVEAYTMGLVADARGDLVFFISQADDEAWIRTNSVQLLEPATSLIAALEASGSEFPALRALNEKWFPSAPAGNDADSMVTRERAR